MRNVFVVAIVTVLFGGLLYAGDMMGMGMMHHSKKASIDDKRISLNFPPPMKQEQLANMRSHLEAVKTIVDFISKGKFDEASKVAHQKLGLTPDMQKMCGMVKNKGFASMGLSFHKSADKLGNVLKTKDVKKSLQALNQTLSFCVQCHATYRQ